MDGGVLSVKNVDFVLQVRRGIRISISNPNRPHESMLHHVSTTQITPEHLHTCTQVSVPGTSHLEEAQSSDKSCTAWWRQEEQLEVRVYFLLHVQFLFRRVISFDWNMVK